MTAMMIIMMMMIIASENVIQSVRHLYMIFTHPTDWPRGWSLTHKGCQSPSTICQPCMRRHLLQPVWICLHELHPKFNPAGGSGNRLLPFGAGAAGFGSAAPTFGTAFAAALTTSQYPRTWMIATPFFLQACSFVVLSNSDFPAPPTSWPRPWHGKGYQWRW